MSQITEAEHALAGMVIALADELLRTNPHAHASLLSSLARLQRGYQSRGHETSSHLVGVVRREMLSRDGSPPPSADVVPFQSKPDAELVGDGH